MTILIMMMVVKEKILQWTMVIDELKGLRTQVEKVSILKLDLLNSAQRAAHMKLKF